MTTSGIPQAAQAAGVLAKLGQSTRQRKTKVVNETAELKKREDDIILGAATALQHVKSEQAVLREESNLIAEIEAREAQLKGSAPKPNSEPEIKKDLDPITPDPVLPAESVAPVVTPPPATPPAAPSSATTTTRKSGWKTTEWSKFQKGIAVVFFIFGALFGLQTVEWANSDWIGIGMVMFNILWVVGMGLAVGWTVAFIFGWITDPKPEKVVTETTTTTRAPAPASAS